MGQQESKLQEGMILRHKKGDAYLVEDLEAFYSEYYDPENPDVAPLEVPMVCYRALYGECLKWFRPLRMFTADRFTAISVDDLTKHEFERYIDHSK